MRNILLVLCCGLLAIGQVQAQVYKWVDENGKLQFSDKPPPEKPAEDISQQLEKTNVDHASGKMATAAPPKRDKTEDEKQLEQRKRQEIEDRIGKQCRAMKKDMDAIARGERGIFVDKDGKEELVLERDRDKKLQEWKDEYRRRGCELIVPLE